MATEIDENIREALRLQESVLLGLLGDAVYGKFVAVKATWAANARQQHGASASSSNSSFIHWLLAFTDNNVAAEISHNHGQHDMQQYQQHGEVLQMEQNCIKHPHQQQTRPTLCTVIKTEPCTNENNFVISNITHITSGDEIAIPTDVGLHSATDPSHVTLDDLPRFGVNENVNKLEEPAVEEGSDIDSMQDGNVDTEADIAVEPVLNTMLDTPPVVVTPPPTSAPVKLEIEEPWPQVSSNGPALSHTEPAMGDTEPVESPPAPELNPEVQDMRPKQLKNYRRKRYSCSYCSYTTTKSAASLRGHEMIVHRQFKAKTKTLQKTNTQHMSVGHNEEVEGRPAEHSEANSTFSPSPPTQLSTTSPSLLSAPAVPTPSSRTFYRCTVCDYCYPLELPVLSHIARTHLDALGKSSQRRARMYNVHELAAQPDVTIVDVSMIDLHDGVHKVISQYYRVGDKRRKKSNRAVMTEAIEVMRKMTEAIAASDNAAFENSET